MNKTENSLLLASFSGAAFAAAVYKGDIPVFDCIANGLIFLSSKTPLGDNWLGASIVAGFIAFLFALIIFLRFFNAFFPRDLWNKQKNIAKWQRTSVPKNGSITAQLKRLWLRFFSR